MKSREDWLCDQLNNDSISEELKVKYEKELDMFADRYNTVESRRKLAQKREEARLQELREKILANNDDFIKSFGEEEFGQDYDVVQEGDQFIVYSKVCKDDQEHRRVHLTLEAANADLRYLFYNRLYDRYVRNGGELTNLMELTNG